MDSKELKKYEKCPVGGLQTHSTQNVDTALTRCTHRIH